MSGLHESDAPAVVIDRRDTALWILLDRPHAGNSVNAAMFDGLEHALDVASGDPELRSVVLTGAGGNFCAGADIAEHGAVIRSGRVDDAADTLLRGARITDRLADLPMPTIAAVDGAAMAGGFELVLACDIVVATRRARFADAHVAHGFIPGWGSTSRAPAKLGPALAARLLLVGDALPAERLPGLVSDVVDHDDLEAHVTAITERIAAAGPTAIATVKRLISARPERDHAEAMAAEADALVAHLRSDDLVEGATAFDERRPPTFGPRTAD